MWFIFEFCTVCWAPLWYSIDHHIAMTERWIDFDKQVLGHGRRVRTEPKMPWRATMCSSHARRTCLSTTAPPTSSGTPLKARTTCGKLSRMRESSLMPRVSCSLWSTQTRTLVCLISGSAFYWHGCVCVVAAHVHLYAVASLCQRVMWSGHYNTWRKPPIQSGMDIVHHSYQKQNVGRNWNS